MKLSALVNYRRHLDEITQDISDDPIKEIVDPVMYSVTNAPEQSDVHVQLLQQARDKIQQGFDDYKRSIAVIKHDVDIEIEKQQPTYLSKSYELYQEMQKADSVEYILNRRISINEQTRELVLARIRRRDTWKHPALIIRPGLEDWIDSMVAFDPLYVADQDMSLMTPARDKFPPLYQRRVRWTVINERDDHEILSRIPNEQLGFCMAWNFFHFKPFELIRQYMKEIYSKLRPGGVFAFSFNDCDRPGGVDNAERMWMCYTPGSMIQAMAEHVGFQTVFKEHLDRSVSWIEFQKPGDLPSLRGGQALAKVIPKNLPKVDNTKNKIYTQSEIENIIQQAIDLNIDTPHQLRHAYSPQKLETIIRKRKSK